MLLIGCSGEPSEIGFLDKEFILDSIEGYDPVHMGVSLDFDEPEWWESDAHYFGFYAGCNTGDGEFRWVDGQMLVSGFFVTELGCDGGVDELEQWFFSFFLSDPMLAYDGELLTLSGEGVSITFVEDVEETGQLE